MKLNRPSGFDEKHTDRLGKSDDLLPVVSAVMLAVESNNVIDMRLRKVATLSPADASAEIALMVSEKVEAAMQTAKILMFGGSTMDVVTHYREQVAANNSRLSVQ